MAIYEGITTVNLIAGEDLRDSKNFLLHINTEGRVIKTTESSNIVVGVLAENPSSDVETTGRGVPVVLLGGILKVRANNTVSPGEFVIPSDTNPGHANGFPAITAGNFSVGIAIGPATVGQVFNIVAHTLLG